MTADLPPSEPDGDKPDASSVDDGLLGDLVVPPAKTPFFQASNSPRYQRQALIRETEQSLDSSLICYVSGRNTSVEREDVVCFVDLLHNIAPGSNVDLLLHTGGGDIDAAEKLITMMRKKVGTARLRVIVPDYAKSAGTLMALGADAIVMSDTSELGPIDPQVVRADRNGNRMLHSVKNYLDAYDSLCKALKDDPENVASQVMLSKLDPETVQLFRGVMKRARQFAEKALKQGMMQNGGNWSQTVSKLLDNERFLTHGQPISWEDARDPEIGLTVEYLGPNDPKWLELWQLYCLQKLAVRDDEKLFESQVASLIVSS